MITVSEIVCIALAFIFHFGFCALAFFTYRREQERVFEESKSRIEMYNAIIDLCESWVESNGT